jgi:hypothetical protein
MAFPHWAGDWSRRPLPANRAIEQWLPRAMQHRRRRVFVESSKGRISAGFTVSETADAADVSLKLRERGWAPYRLQYDRDQNAWIAIVIDWKHAA